MAAMRQKIPIMITCKNVINALATPRCMCKDTSSISEKIDSTQQKETAIACCLFDSVML